jgi:hypothetical protein
MVYPYRRVAEGVEGTGVVLERERNSLVVAGKTYPHRLLAFAAMPVADTIREQFLKDDVCSQTRIAPQPGVGAE